VTKDPELPIIVRKSLWVDLRDWKSPQHDAFARLQYGILAKPPGDSPIELTADEVDVLQKGKASRS